MKKQPVNKDGFSVPSVQSKPIEAAGISSQNNDAPGIIAQTANAPGIAGQPVSVPGTAPMETMIMEIPLKSGHASSESGFDFPLGYASINNIYPFRHNNLRCLYTPTNNNTKPFSGTLITLLVTYNGILGI